MQNKIVKIASLVKRRLKKKMGILKVEDVHNYWKNPEDFGNTTEEYLSQNESAKLMCSLIKKLLGVKKDKSIIELGCNCGRNLNNLAIEGYTNLSGIDISQKAINLMKAKYPEIYYNSNIKIDSLEASLPKIKDNSFDVVFSLAVLMHIPYQSNSIFKEIVRISKQYVITLENEIMPHVWSHYPRDYKKIFEDLGMEEVYFINQNIIKNYMVRIFKKVNK